jgi:hypothetical protein
MRKVNDGKERRGGKNYLGVHGNTFKLQRELGKTV